MTQFTGTRALTRLALRLDRVRLPIWVASLSLMPMATAAQYQKLYPTEADIAKVSTVLHNASLTAMNGQLYQISLGGLTAWKIGATQFTLISLMSLLTVVRHTRTEEESGRLELVSAGVVGRFAPLTAALITAAIANLATAAGAALGLIAVGMPAAGSVAFGLATAAVGLVFAGIAGLAAQLTASARSATGIAASALGVAFALRSLGDTGETWLSWLSPIGWAMRVRAYGSERWWLLLVTVAFAAGCAAGSYALNSRRDLGAGLLPQRPGPAQAAASLRSPLALAWRLQRGVFTGWLVAMLFWGAALGSVVDAIGSADVNQQMADILARMGGTHALVDSYLGAVFAITGVVVTAYTVQAMLRLRAEESAGRAEPLLATRVNRVSLALSHLVFALVGPAVLLTAAGLSAGLAYGAQAHDIAGQVPRLLGAALVQLPATWVLAGLTVALFGLAPRVTVLAWAGLIACGLIQEVGALLEFDQLVMDVSPFSHIPKLPGSDLTTTPLLWLTAIAAIAVAAGLTGFRRRDIG